LAYVLNTHTLFKEFKSDFMVTTKIPKIHLTRPEGDDISEGSGRFFTIDSIHLNRNLEFCYDSLGNINPQNVGTSLKKLLEKIYKNEIQMAMDLLKENIRLERDKVEEQIAMVKTKYAKQLVYAEMMENKNR
jgi:hypothetical protein